MTRVKLRKRALRRAGVTYGQLAAEAGVSYSMIFKFMSGDRVSAKIQAAFDRMTHVADAGAK